MDKLSLIDTHCDTASELYNRKQSILSNECHISLCKAENYENYAQFFAVWSDKQKSDDECFEDFLHISDNLKKEISENSRLIALVTSYDEMQAAFENRQRAAFLAVEDARLLGGDLSRLDVLSERGVKYLTLMWGGNTCIGSSHDVAGGLTDFGRAVVERCFELGIVPDLSHANDCVSDEVINMAYAHKKPVIASHSNCRSVYAHTRNLSDEHIKAIAELGGVIGLNLCRSHLCDAKNTACTADTLISHIEGFLSLGARHALGLGCDLDGAPLPDGFSGVGDLYKLARAMKDRGFAEDTVNDIFCNNFEGFIKRNFT